MVVKQADIDEDRKRIYFANERVNDSPDKRQVRRGIVNGKNPIRYGRRLELKSREELTVSVVTSHGAYHGPSLAIGD